MVERLRSQSSRGQESEVRNAESHSMGEIAINASCGEARENLASACKRIQDVHKRGRSRETGRELAGDFTVSPNVIEHRLMRRW